MEEDEELFREMDEEDDFYMGDSDNQNSDDQNDNNQKDNSGCAGIVLLILCIGIASLCI